MVGAFSTQQYNNYKKVPAHPGRAVTDHYTTITALEGFIVVAFCNNKGFEVCKISEFLRRDAVLPAEQRLYHEVVDGAMRQKMRLDVDVKVAALEPLGANSLSIVEEMLSRRALRYIAAAEGLERRFRVVLMYMMKKLADLTAVLWGVKSKLVLFRSYCPAESKFSAHIVETAASLSSSYQAKAVARRLAETMPEVFAKMIDFGPYSSLSQFRLPNHCKSGDAARPKLLEAAVSAKHLKPGFGLITHCAGLPLLDDIAEKQDEPNAHFGAEPEADDIVIGEALRLYRGHAAFDRDGAAKYRNTTNGFIAFDREAPSHCHICDEIHHKDNSVVLQLSRDGDASSMPVLHVLLRCRQNMASVRAEGASAGNVFIGSIALDPEQNSVVATSAEAPTAKGAAAIVRESFVGNRLKSAMKTHLDRRNADKWRETTEFDALPAAQKLEYSKPTMCPYAPAEVLCIKAPMGLGKTKELQKFIAANFKIAPGDMARHRIVFVSFRQTFTSQIKLIFPQATCYNEVSGPLNQDIVVCQVESLHRLECGPTPPDLLVLDEVEMIIEQFAAGLGRSQGAMVAMFEYLLRYSGMVICMDALLSDRCFRVLEAARPAFRDVVRYHCNNYRNETTKTVQLFDARATWIKYMMQCVEDGERIVVATNIKSWAKSFESMCRSAAPDRVVKLYSSDTLPSERREHFKNVDDYWCGIDILIYTPTVTAGVSFEAQHFDRCFAAFSNMSCSAMACKQMLNRVRSLVSNEVNIFIETQPCWLPVAREDILEFRMAQYRHYGFAAQCDGDAFSMFPFWTFAKNGEATIRDDDFYLRMCVENDHRSNRSRVDFCHELVQILGENGATLRHIDWDDAAELLDVEPGSRGMPSDELVDIGRQFNEEIEMYKKVSAKSVAEARDLDESEVADLYQLMAAEQDIGAADRFALEKAKLRRWYEWRGDIDETWVAHYKSERTRNAFRALRWVLRDQDPNVGLEAMHVEEVRHLQECIDMAKSVEAHNSVKISLSTRLAIELLQDLGWNNVDSTAAVGFAAMRANLENEDGPLWTKHELLARQFSLPMLTNRKTVRGSDEWFALSLDWVNKVLRAKFLVGIKKKSNSAGVFVLNRTPLFSFDADDDSKPIVALGGSVAPKAAAPLGAPAGEAGGPPPGAEHRNAQGMIIAK